MDPDWPATATLLPHLRPKVGEARARGSWPMGGLLRALGVLEPMPRGLVRRPGGSGDVFIAWFPHNIAARTPDGLIELPPDSALAWRPGMVQEYGRADAAWIHSWIHLRGPLGTALTEGAGLPFGRAIAIREPTKLETMLMELRAEASSAEPDGVVMEALIAVFLRRLSQCAPAVEDGLDEVRRHIDANLEKSPPLAELALLAGCSVPHLCVSFARRFGLPPQRYALALRLERAALLLRAQLTPGEVAERCGWGDRRQFARCFRRRFGVPPSDFLHTSKGRQRSS